MSEYRPAMAFEQPDAEGKPEYIAKRTSYEIASAETPQIKAERAKGLLIDTSNLAFSDYMLSATGEKLQRMQKVDADIDALNADVHALAQRLEAAEDVAPQDIDALQERHVQLMEKVREESANS